MTGKSHETAASLLETTLTCLLSDQVFPKARAISKLWEERSASPSDGRR
jgi:hypothetical protein